MAWTLLIKSGTVLDGSGAPGVMADVALEAGWRMAGWVRHHHEVDEAVIAAPTRGE